MQIIRDLEPTPRGVYTGAIGYIGPRRQARFSVAIRTVVIDKPAGRAEFGVGSGVVWDSDADSEYAECRTKAEFLTRRIPEFELLETLRFDPGQGYLLLEEHLQRLAQSAEYFDFRVDLAELRWALAEYSDCPVSPVLRGEGWGEGSQRLVAPPARTPLRIRLRVNRAGQFHLDSSPAPADRGRPWRLKLAPHPVDPSDVFLYHKTTNRVVYDGAYAARGDCDDVLLWNNRGELTETTIANIVFELDGQLVTPPLSCGLLAGVFRGHLLKMGEIREHIVRLDDLPRCRRILAVNSVRRRMPAELACRG